MQKELQNKLEAREYMSTERFEIRWPKELLDLVRLWAERAGMKPTQFIVMSVRMGAPKLAKKLGVYRDSDPVELMMKVIDLD